MIRISVGVEGIDDLTLDFGRALDRLGYGRGRIP
jgi:O-acetylhomoserine/O-acetylserine sulfhydrylase-like pyridoxal-dependent enzyme